jgi:four helix bundle protein
MSFDFRDTKVYTLAKLFHKDILNILNDKKVGKILTDQLTRASISIVLNLAEGYGRFHKADKRNFYVTARASLNECIACLDIIFDNEIPDEVLKKADELGKMISGLINKFLEK